MFTDCAIPDKGWSGGYVLSLPEHFISNSPATNPAAIKIRDPVLQSNRHVFAGSVVGHTPAILHRIDINCVDVVVSL